MFDANELASLDSNYFTVIYKDGRNWLLSISILENA